MRLFGLVFLFLPILSVGQALKDNYYLNSEAGFSIKFDKDWKVKIPDKATHPVFAAKSKYQTISVGLQPVGADFKPEYTKEEADAAKPQIENALKARKVIIAKISVTPGMFQGKKCLITIAHLTETRDEDRVPVYHKTIQFVHKGNLFNILYNIPLSNLNELENMEKQLKTMKFF